MSDFNKNEAGDPIVFGSLDAQLLNIIRDGNRRQSCRQMIIDHGPDEAGRRQMGFSPLINPIDGSKYGDEGFRPYWDSLLHHDGWFELTVTFSEGSLGFFIKDDDAVDSKVRQMCLQFAE